MLISSLVLKPNNTKELHMTTALAVLEKVATSARTHKNPSTRVVTKESTLPYGKVIRQGDVMLRRHPIDKVFEDLIPETIRQLAPGESVGSRHVLREGNLKTFARKGATALQGPIVVAPEGFYLEHPTHAHVDCKLPGVYEVTYPRDMAAEGIARRAD
jgi:hypothetical protein